MLILKKRVLTTSYNVAINVNHTNGITGSEKTKALFFKNKITKGIVPTKRAIYNKELYNFIVLLNHCFLDNLWDRVSTFLK